MIENKSKQGGGGIVVLIVICVALYAIGRGCRSDHKKQSNKPASGNSSSPGTPAVTKPPPASSSASRALSKTLPSVQRPTSLGSTPRDIAERTAQWLDAVEFEINAAMLENPGSDNLQSLKSRLSAISTELAKPEGLAAALALSKRKLAEQRSVIEAQMKSSESTMRSAYAETLDAVTKLDNQIAKTAARLDVLKTRTTRLAGSVNEWEQYLAKTTPVIGADAAMAGVEKLIKGASAAWVESSLQGR